MIETQFDSGKIVIVPLLPDRPTLTQLSQLSSWFKSETRQYMVRIIDNQWGMLDHRLGPDFCTFITVSRSLDGPGRLDRAQDTGQGAVVALQDEMGNLFWGGTWEIPISPEK